MRPSICFEHGGERFPERGVSPAGYLHARSGHVLPGVGARPKLCPFIFHELKRIKKTFTFWLRVPSSPAESCLFCRISCFSNYFRFSKRNFSSFFDPLWTAHCARGASLVSRVAELPRSLLVWANNRPYTACPLPLPLFSPSCFPVPADSAALRVHASVPSA